MTNYIYIISIVILWIKTKPGIKLFNRKPFNCELCMAWWVSLVYCLINGENIGVAAIIALLAPLCLSLYNKIWRILMK